MYCCLFFGHPLPPSITDDGRHMWMVLQHVLPLLAVLANELHLPAAAIKYAAEMERAAAASPNSKEEKENKMVR